MGYQTFEELNAQERVLSVHCKATTTTPSINDEETWSTEQSPGRYMCACSSTISAGNHGWMPFGPNNLLRNQAVFADRMSELSRQGEQGLKAKNYRPREGAGRTWTAVSGVNRSDETLLGGSGGQGQQAPSEHQIVHKSEFLRGSNAARGRHTSRASDDSNSLAHTPLSLRPCLSPQPLTSASDHASFGLTLHSVVPTVISKRALKRVYGESAKVGDGGPTISQFATEEKDLDPTLIVSLPVGCLLEEIILVDGFQGSAVDAGVDAGIDGASDEAEGSLQTIEGRRRLELFKVSVYHVDPLRLTAVQDAKEGKHYSIFRKVISSCVEPVWSGTVRETGKYTAAVRLREWALAEKRKEAKRKKSTVSKLASEGKLGAIYYSGATACAKLDDPVGAEDDSERDVAAGVIGNVILVKWNKDDPLVRELKTHNIDHRLLLGGLVLVGRRIRDPLWRGLDVFQQAVEKTIDVMPRQQLYRVIDNELARSSDSRIQLDAMGEAFDLAGEPAGPKARPIMRGGEFC